MTKRKKKSKFYKIINVKKKNTNVTKLQMWQNQECDKTTNIKIWQFKTWQLKKTKCGEKNIN